MAYRRLSNTITAEEGNMRKRKQDKTGKNQHWEPSQVDEWDSTLPYGGKVYLARQKKPDTWLVLIIEVVAVVAAFSLAYYAYFYFDNFHYHVTRGYAHLGFSDAQHVLGEKYFHGHGVDQDKHKAMDWYKLASDQGHPHASYNLAVGHLKGVRKDLLQKGEPHKLIKQAASKGVKEALDVLNDFCVHGHCED